MRDIFERMPPVVTADLANLAVELGLEQQEKAERLERDLAAAHRTIGEIVLLHGGRIEVPDIMRVHSPRLTTRYDPIRFVTVIEAEEVR